MRLKANTFEVEDPDKAMGKFTSLLGKLVKVHKREVEAKRAKLKNKHARRKRRRRS